jgi:hypothetical protein
VVLLACRRILADHEAEDQEIMVAVSTIREQSRQLPDDQYATHPMMW